MYRLDVECPPLSHEIHLLSNNLSKIISLRSFPFVSPEMRESVPSCPGKPTAIQLIAQKKPAPTRRGRMPVAEIVS
jgi:hypothetical protein